MSKIQIKEVRTEKDWDAFIDLPWKIYPEKFPKWVPPLRIAVRETLDVNKNPFFKHAYMTPLLALRGDEVVGRIVGVMDEVHNKFHNEATGFFGFFESIDDQEVANALLERVADWCKNWGMKTLRGPMNPSTNHECGLLVKGYDYSPMVMMTYNPPYYEKLIESFGLAKAKDLFAFEISGDRKFTERLFAQAERLKRRRSITFRPVRLRDFKKEVDRILEVYNDAWEANWGFVPMSEEEFQHMAKDMKMILDPRLLMIAEVNDEVAGFGLALPDINQILIKNKSGKLFPFGLAKLLWGLKGPTRRLAMNQCRILTLGVKKKFINLGLGPLLYAEYFKVGPAIGYPIGEASWILEDNQLMVKAAKNMRGELTKVYRIYDKAL